MRLLAITDRRLLGRGEDEQAERLVQQAARWAAAGVDGVVLREKDLDPAALRSLALRVSAALHGSRTQLYVHLGAVPAESWEQAYTWAPAVYLPAPLAGPVPVPLCVGVHSSEEGARAREHGAEAVVFAPVYEKPLWAQSAALALRPEPAARIPGEGLPALRRAVAAAAPVPVYALGGVSVGNAQACIAAGAAGVAGIRLFAGDAWRQLLGTA